MIRSTRFIVSSQSCWSIKSIIFFKEFKSALPRGHAQVFGVIRLVTRSRQLYFIKDVPGCLKQTFDRFFSFSCWPLFLRKPHLKYQVTATCKSSSIRNLMTLQIPTLQFMFAWDQKLSTYWYLPSGYMGYNYHCTTSLVKIQWGCSGKEIKHYFIYW